MVKKILIAEDDPDIRLILKMVLGEAGYEVEARATGNSILEGKEEWPDLFILDRALPMVDGITISKYLKVNRETKNIPIIMISSYHELRNKATAVGVDDFVDKPFNIKDLLDVVNKHIAARGVKSE